MAYTSMNRLSLRHLKKMTWISETVLALKGRLRGLGYRPMVVFTRARCGLWKDQVEEVWQNLASELHIIFLEWRGAQQGLTVYS